MWSAVDCKQGPIYLDVVFHKRVVESIRDAGYRHTEQGAPAQNPLHAQVSVSTQRDMCRQSGLLVEKDQCDNDSDRSRDNARELPEPLRNGICVTSSRTRPISSIHEQGVISCLLHQVHDFSQVSASLLPFAFGHMSTDFLPFQGFIVD